MPLSPTPYISHHIYNPDANELVPVSTKEYQESRRERDRKIKETPSSFTEVYVDIKPISENPARFRPGENNRQFLLKPFERAKVIGYSHDIRKPDGTKTPTPVQSRGTSKKNLLCVTDNMYPCQAVAIGGEKPTKEEGAKVRVFHAYPSNKDVAEHLRAYVRKLRDEGLNVRAAMHGGNESESSLQMAAQIRNLFGNELADDVVVDFDEMSQNRPDNTPLGAVITDENEVKFVTEIFGDDLRK